MQMIYVCVVLCAWWVAIGVVVTMRLSNKILSSIRSTCICNWCLLVCVCVQHYNHLWQCTSLCRTTQMVVVVFVTMCARNARESHAGAHRVVDAAKRAVGVIGGLLAKLVLVLCARTAFTGNAYCCHRTQERNQSSFGCFVPSAPCVGSTCPRHVPTRFGSTLRTHA